MAATLPARPARRSEGSFASAWVFSHADGRQLAAPGAPTPSTPTDLGSAQAPSPLGGAPQSKGGAFRGDHRPVAPALGMEPGQTPAFARSALPTSQSPAGQ